jgi:hypothetical protein
MMTEVSRDQLGPVDHLAAAMEPGSTAGVLIWENLWAAPFTSAARRSGGQLIADGRIPLLANVTGGGTGPLIPTNTLASTADTSGG